MVKISITYRAAILLVRELSVRGHNKTRTALSREFAHEENRHGVHESMLSIKSISFRIAWNLSILNFVYYF